MERIIAYEGYDDEEVLRIAACLRNIFTTRLRRLLRRQKMRDLNTGNAWEINSM